ncbi:hypothetical protein IEQ34_016130 [Dendrobium chrysotoxum]|uniref:Secreted protein n=1 Tax=Dendrobium chrysotoxum TaxID=161865 RepID=A0AAV7GD79_DENCH|nr:hypothetical protein IEQ34_016130 [Dendrobium chrysotoxum]
MWFFGFVNRNSAWVFLLINFRSFLCSAIVAANNAFLEAFFSWIWSDSQDCTLQGHFIPNFPIAKFGPSKLAFILNVQREGHFNL